VAVTGLAAAAPTALAAQHAAPRAKATVVLQHIEFKPAAPRAKATVVLKDIEFKPAAVSLKRGGTVTFAWKDGDTPHNVTPTGAKRFKRLATRKAGSASVRFPRAGTYRYVCTIHPGMDGRIVVR
jgi:plastocyanin